MSATVYRVEFETNTYQAFLYDLPEPDLGLWLFDGTPRQATWAPQPVYSDNPRLRVPGVWSLIGAAVLVMFDDAIASLASFVPGSGELLPLHVVETNSTTYALNILNVVDCLDKGASDFGDPSTRQLSFIEHRLPEDGLFKVPEYDTVDMFVVERSGGVSFRSALDEHDLTGIVLRPVWSSESGTIPLDLAASR